MNAEHYPQGMGRTPADALIMRLNDLFLLLPWHDLIHLVQKSLNPQRLRFHLGPHGGLHEAYSTEFNPFCRGFYICPGFTLVVLLQDHLFHKYESWFHYESIAQYPFFTDIEYTTVCYIMRRAIGCEKLELVRRFEPLTYR